MGKKPSVLVMGVDGATFDIINPLVKAGKMPNFASLMKRGSYCELKSTVPILSPVAWTTFSTGVHPGKHGIFNFLSRHEQAYDIVPSSAAQRRVKPVWKVAGETGRKVAVLNVPATFPADEVNGIMISGDPTPFHDERRVYPREAYQSLEERFGKHFLKPAPPLRSERTFLNNLLQSVQLWTDLTKFTVEKTDCDLAVVVYTATDTGQHFFWRTMDKDHPQYHEKTSAQFGTAIQSIYQKIDWALGEMLTLADENTNIIILSDHGFGPLNQAVPLKKWLLDKGYMTYERDHADRKRSDIAGLLRFILSRLRLTEGLPPIGTLRGVDWSKTKAYFLGVSGDLFINLKGREPQGIVSPGKEYDDLVAEISGELRSMKLPDGSSPVEAVYLGKDIYPGSAGSPDIFIQWAKGFDLIKEGEPDSILNSLRARTGNAWSGTHLEKGILIMAGPAIKQNQLTAASIQDVAPTIYHLLGIPVPNMMDGTVLSPAITEESLRTLAYDDRNVLEGAAPEQVFSQQDSHAVAEALKNLGYLE